MALPSYQQSQELPSSSQMSFATRILLNGMWQVLIKWIDMPIKDSSWEDYEVIKVFPSPPYWWASIIGLQNISTIVVEK